MALEIKLKEGIGASKPSSQTSLPVSASETTDSRIKAYNMADYLANGLQGDLDEFAAMKSLKTGYENLDELTSLYPGLYVLGAISSLGKTTFAHQMADQIAASGTPVIFFSLEQTVLELASKSLARTLYQVQHTPMSSIQIRRTGQTDVQKTRDYRTRYAVDTYKRYAGNVNIVEGTFRADIDSIEQYVSSFIATNHQKPVVFIDYLQVIPAPEGQKMSTKDLVDMNVRRLKQLQEDQNIVLIVISSLNRQNYLQIIDYESFKESGGIEYTADVIWGLQLQILRDPLFDKQGGINEKRSAVQKAKREDPRKIELVCLKNRFGISSYSCFFDYYSRYDVFDPDMTHQDTVALQAQRTD